MQGIFAKKERKFGVLKHQNGPGIIIRKGPITGTGRAAYIKRGKGIAVNAFSKFEMFSHPGILKSFLQRKFDFLVSLL
jgi:hypothetical protein